MNNRLGAGQGGNGAGVYVIGNSETQKGIVNIDGGSIENNLANSAGGSGGGICVSNYGELNMISGIIADNESVSGGGGGVYVQSDGIFNMSGGSIEDNTAYNGGGIAVYGTLNATGGDITGNTATTPPTTTSPNTSFRGKGGGIYVGQGAKNVTLGGLTISNNTAHGYGTANSTDSFGVGGGVCFDDGITTASDFSAIITGNTVISNNKAIASNTISSPTTVVSATSEYSGLGGGIYRGKDVDLVLQDVSITGNTAYRGGGVYSNDTGTGTLTLEKDSTNPTSAGPSITNNTAEAAIDGYTTEITTDGGGIYTNADSSNPAAVKTTITAVQIKNNTAESNGGGAYFAGDVAMDGKVAIDNSNSAAGQANGAYLGTNIIIVTALDQDTDIHIGGVSGPAPGRIIATNAALDAASRFTLGTALSDYIAAYDNGNVILAPRPTYTVTLNVNGGNNLAKSTITVEKDGTYDDLPTPARTDHTFNGWYTAPQGGTKVSTGDKIAVNADHILYAQWSDDKVSVSPKTADSMDAALYLVITAALLSLAAAVLYRRRFNS